MIFSKQRLFAQLYRKPDDDGDGAAGGSSAGSGAIGTGNDTRLAMLAAINDANDRENAEELADVMDDGSTVPFVPTVDEDAEVTTEVVAAPEVTEVEVVDEPVLAEPKKIKIKVNGKEIELTQDELIARAQKVESADEYLAAAKRSIPVAPPTPTGPTAEELRAARELEDRAIVRAIQMGSEEEALAAIQKLTARQARPSITADDVSIVIDQRLTFNEAITHFRKDFSDIASDPVLYQLAQQRDDALIEAGDKRSYADRYAQIGTELRSWKESLVPKVELTTPEVPNTSLADKKAKKDAAPKPLVTATKKVAQVTTEEDDGEENPSDVIRAMQKQRGGPAWMRT